MPFRVLAADTSVVAKRRGGREVISLSTGIHRVEVTVEPQQVFQQISMDEDKTAVLNVTRRR